MDPEALLFTHTEVLASNEFEGRFPGTIGEEKTLKYLTSEFEKVGAIPGIF